MSAFGPAALAAAGLPLSGDAAALAALVREAVATGAAREALHLRLGALGPELLRGGGDGGPQLLVREALTPLLRPSRARLFALPNGDLVALAPPGGAHLAAAAERLGILLSGVGKPGVAALLRLPEQAAALLVALEAAVAPPTGAGPPPPRGPGPSSADAAALERALGTASLASFLRCRPVMRLAPAGGSAPESQWTEWRLALPELCAALLPGVDVRAAGPGLARRLRGAAERRLLAELARPEEAHRLGAAWLPLGLASLGTPEFRRLDDALGQAGRALLVLGFRAEEVLADPAGFLAAREVCGRRGYRLALELTDPGALALLPPERLGVALLRLPWSPALAEAGLPPGVRLPEGRVVLAGVDRAAAIAWGWDTGITLFEGRLLRG